MNDKTLKTCNIILLVVTIIVTVVGCFDKMSEVIQDKSAGKNGSFEAIQSGLPVNWIIYSPATIPEGNYELVIDTAEYVDGNQSLKFVVHECSPTGGWHSPGISQESNANPGNTYTTSFWIKNDGSSFCVKIGGISAFEGQHETIIESNDSIREWKIFEYDYTMPTEYETIRFELNVLSPGSFWIDDVRIEANNKK